MRADPPLSDPLPEPPISVHRRENQERQHERLVLVPVVEEVVIEAQEVHRQARQGGDQSPRSAERKECERSQHGADVEHFRDAHDDRQPPPRP